MDELNNNDSDKEVVAPARLCTEINSDHMNDAMVPIANIQSLIFEVRGQQVMLDFHLAKLYSVENRQLKQAVRRNSDRFPDDFMFRLTKDEANTLISIGVSQSVIPPGYNLGASEMFVFTEQGVSMLSSVLRSPVAMQMSIRIMRAFVAMRRFISANAGMFQRIESLERHQLETDRKIDQVLDQLEVGQLKEKAHIFSAGQVYEAKAFITELIGRAKTRVVLVDGYVSAPTIDLLDARQDGVSATIYTGGVGNALKALRVQYNVQFPQKPLAIEKWRTEQHDRWLIIDDELWHCGASIRDAGVRTFGIDPIGLDVNVVLGQV